MPDITLVVVNYFSARLTRDAIASARASTSAALHAVVVDNSSDEDERRALESAGADEVIVSPDNAGYAGGANRGVAVATTRVVVVSNPDVVFSEGCIDLLAERIRGDVAVAGPLFHWDAGGKWLLPPADWLDVREKVLRVLASRFAGAARRRARQRLRRRIDFWRRREPGPADALSGAVMALDRRRLEEVGGFDERFALYFEEIDLIRRLRARGGAAWYVPAARCCHLYDQSAGSEPSSHEKFAASEELYLKRWVPLARVLGRLERVAAHDGSGFASIEPADPIPLPDAGREWLVEASPLLSFESAAGCLASGSTIVLPEEIWAGCRSPALYLRVVDPVSLTIGGRFVMRRRE